MGLKFKLGETEEIKQNSSASEKKQKREVTSQPQKIQMNVQDHFLNTLRKEGQRIIITLLDGTKVEGKISGFDTFSIIIDDGTKSKLLYKHAISMLTKI
jgi:host factor-I protein